MSTSQEAEGGKCWNSVVSFFPLFFMKFKSPAKLGLPSVTPFWEPIQKCVSWVTPNSIELVKKTKPLGLHQNITWDPINMLDNYVLYQLINE